MTVEKVIAKIIWLTFFGPPCIWVPVTFCLLFCCCFTIICYPTRQCSRIRILRFFRLQKSDFLTFFEMTYQKVVNSQKKYHVC